MHRLDDIFKISQRILAGETPPALPDGESQIFNAAWLVFELMTPDRLATYSKLWNAGAGMMMNKPVEPMSVKSVTRYSNLICHSYIACGLNSAQKLRDRPQDDAQHTLSQTISPKLMFITALALAMNTQRVPYSADGKLPDDLRAALSEFYSLAHFTLTELKANVVPAFHEGINTTLHDIGYITAKLDLPRLLSADARDIELAALSGVPLMPKRPGIALATPDAGATVLDFSRALRRNAAKNAR